MSSKDTNIFDLGSQAFGLGKQMAETTVTFRLKDINSHLVCRLCNGYFRDAHTITECLHTFCKSCLFLEIAKGLMVCPHCKIDLSPHPRNRVLYDRTLQAIVDKIFPELEDQDRAQEDEFYAARGIKRKPEPEPSAAMSSLATVSPSRGGSGDEEDGDEEERPSAPPKRKRSLNNGSYEDGDEDDGEQRAHGAESKSDGRYRARKSQPGQPHKHARNQKSTPPAEAEQFDFKILPDPAAAPGKELPLLPKPFLRTKCTVKVAKVKKYLGKKLNIDPETIAFSVKGRMVGNDVLLEEVMQNYWRDSSSSVVFNYRAV